MRLRGAGLALLCAAAVTATAAETSFVVKYRSASTVYLEGGRAQGLAAGQRLVVRGPAGPAAELEVVFVAEQSASCRIVSEKRPVAPGDLALMVPPAAAAPALASTARVPAREAPRIAATPPSPPAPAPVATVAAPVARTVPFARYRGGLSLGYYRVDDAGVTGSEQRSASADFRAWDIAGQPITFAARMRMRRDTRLAAPSSPALRDDRVYELALRYQPPSGRLSLEAGRIGASGWASVGTLDGVLGELRLVAPLNLGGFYGRRVDLGRLGAPASARRYGGFLRLAPARGRSYELLLGGVRETEGGEPSREYLAVEGRAYSSRWSFYERAELDVNRGWRKDLAGRPYQLTNLVASTTLRFGDAHSATISYDNRRNHRDLANRTIPEAIFDDAMRQGVRASLYLGQPRGFNVAVNGGARLNERDGRTGWSYGGTLRHGNLFGQGVAASVDGSAFTNGYTEGWLATAMAGRSFGTGHYLDASYGMSRYRERGGAGSWRVTRWVRGSARIDVIGGLYVLGDAEYGMGDDFRGLRILAETGYRF